MLFLRTTVLPISLLLPKKRFLNRLKKKRTSRNKKPQCFNGDKWCQDYCHFKQIRRRRRRKRSQSKMMFDRDCFGSARRSWNEISSAFFFCTSSHSSVLSEHEADVFFVFFFSPLGIWAFSLDSVVLWLAPGNALHRQDGAEKNQRVQIQGGC